MKKTSNLRADQKLIAYIRGLFAAKNDNVIYLDNHYPQRSLDNLNRLTGLEFETYPQSLLAYCAVTRIGHR